MGAMKFTIRDTLWLMVVIGLGIALWIERSRNSIARHQLQVLVDVLESVDVQTEVRPDHITITGPEFHAERVIGEPKLDRTRVTPSIRPSPK